MTRLTVSENFSTQTATYMKANGKMTRPTEKALTLMQTARVTRETGETTSSMDSVSRHGLTVLFTRVSTSKARRTAKANLHSLMVQSIMVTLR